MSVNELSFLDGKIKIKDNPNTIDLYFMQGYRPDPNSIDKIEQEFNNIFKNIILEGKWIVLHFNDSASHPNTELAVIKTFEKIGIDHQLTPVLFDWVKMYIKPEDRMEEEAKIAAKPTTVTEVKEEFVTEPPAPTAPSAPSAPIAPSAPSASSAPSPTEVQHPTQPPSPNTPTLSPVQSTPEETTPKPT